MLLIHDPVSMNNIKPHFSPWKWDWHRNAIKWSPVIKQSKTHTYIHLKNNALTENLCDEIILMGVVLCCYFYHAIYQQSVFIKSSTKAGTPCQMASLLQWYGLIRLCFSSKQLYLITTHTFYNRDILSLLIHIIATGLIGIIISMLLLLQLPQKLFTFWFYAISHNRKRDKK